MNEQTENTIINVRVQVDRNSQIMAGVAPTSDKSVPLDLSKLTERQRKALVVSFDSIGALRKLYYSPGSPYFDYSTSSGPVVVDHPADETVVIAVLDDNAEALDEKERRLAKAEEDKRKEAEEMLALRELGAREIAELSAAAVSDPVRFLYKETYGLAPWRFARQNLKGRHGSGDYWYNFVVLKDLSGEAQNAIHTKMDELNSEVKAAHEAFKAARKAQLDAAANAASGLLGERWAAGLAEESEVLKALKAQELAKYGLEDGENEEWNDWDRLDTIADESFAALKELKAKLPEGATYSLYLYHTDETDDWGKPSITNRAVVAEVAWESGVIALEAKIVLRHLPDKNEI